MKKITATNFILVLFLICFMVVGVYAADFSSNEVSQVPEPSSLLMLGAGLIGVFTLVRKFKKN
jgi:hypothetical protein